MTNTTTNYNGFPGVNWQILGELALPVRSGTDARINAWLTALLIPLNLHAEFQNKVLISALEAASKAEIAYSFKHIHLYIFSPANQISEGQTWGFFRIEKIGNSPPGQEIPGHAIELYLYREGL